MEYEVTIQGTLPTTLSNNLSLETIDLACDCTAAMIMLGVNYTYLSVEARYVGDGDLIVTIRRRITTTEPLTVGEMQPEVRNPIETELSSALCAPSFSHQDWLDNMRITEVTPLPED